MQVWLPVGSALDQLLGLGPPALSSLGGLQAGDRLTCSRSKLPPQNYAPVLLSHFCYLLLLILAEKLKKQVSVWNV